MKMRHPIYNLDDFTKWDIVIDLIWEKLSGDLQEKTSSTKVYNYLDYVNLRSKVEGFNEMDSFLSANFEEN